MIGKELSPVQRFNKVWDKVTSDGTRPVQAPSVSAEDGAVTSIVINAHEESPPVGSLRPRIRTLEITAGDIKVSLTEGRATFWPRGEYVQGVLSAMERILPTLTSS